MLLGQKIVQEGKKGDKKKFKSELGGKILPLKSKEIL